MPNPKQEPKHLTASVRIPQEVAKRVSREMKKQYRSRSSIVTEALAEWLQRLEASRGK